jgi:hypothetical protein
MNDIYQAIDFYNTSGLGGACYRHELENVRITNYTNPKTRAGSFGIRFGGNVEGDSSGNDSRLRGVFVKAYEKNVIIQKSVGTKFTQCSIDGGGVALELDGGSYISLCQCYIEYNDTFLNAVNNPYRPMLLATTVSNYTTYMVGTLYNSEELLDYSSNSPIIMKRKRTFNGQENLIVRPIAPHGGGLEINNDGKSFDFIKVGTKYALVPTEDIDLYEHIPVGKKKFFGNILSTDFTSIDEYGVVRYSKLLPNSGLVTVAAGTTSPDVGRNPILVTSNTSATTIVRFDYGIVGQKMNLIINDAFTTIAHNTNIKLKGKANKACAVDDTFEFICTAAPTDTTCVWYEI